MTKQKRTVIFGATGGIGASLTAKLHRIGHKLHLVARNQTKLEALSNKYNATYTTLDSNLWDSCRVASEQANERLGGLTGVVNCIGTLLLKPIHLTKEAEFDTILNANLKTSAAILSATTPNIVKADEEDKSIVLLSSVAASVGIANHEAVSASKAGVEGLTLAAAATYSRSRVRVNVVSPGLTATPLTEKILRNSATKEKLATNNPLGRIGMPEEVSDAITWLLSENSKWVTGQVIKVDGGYSTLKTAHA